MSIALAGSELPHHAGSTAAGHVGPWNDLFLSPMFVQTLAQELPVFGPILRGAAAAMGRFVDRYGDPVTEHACAADRLCIPAGGGLRAQVLRYCHDGPLGGHSGLAKTGSLVRRLSF